MSYVLSKTNRARNRTKRICRLYEVRMQRLCQRCTQLRGSNANCSPIEDFINLDSRLLLK